MDFFIISGLHNGQMKSGIGAVKDFSLQSFCKHEVKGNIDTFLVRELKCATMSFGVSIVYILQISCT